MNSILKRIATEYVVHENHDEVHNDMDGTQVDHKNLLEDDQDCLETKTDIQDNSNTGDCPCDDCVNIKSIHTNRIIARIANSK